MKLYQVDKSSYELEATKKTRLEDYGIICGLGIVIMCWGGIGEVLKTINWTDKNHAHYCVIYFTCSLLIMFMGLVSAKSPNSALMPMFIAGLGAWQAMVLVSILASFHLGVVHYIPTPEYTIFPMMATSLPFTLYWGLSVQDPSDAKLVYGSKQNGKMLVREFVEHWQDFPRYHHCFHHSQMLR